MRIDSFARSFSVLPKGHIALCPEGLSRFYWGGFVGEPVASWMTKAERLQEIDDFCTWLDQVYALARSKAPQVKFVLFGFSQGAATIMRWMNVARPQYEALVLWSGTPPEDIDYSPRAYYSEEKLYSLWGDSDELVAWKRAKQRYDEVPLSFQHQNFEGGHSIVGSLLAELAEQISKQLMLSSAD